MGQEDKGFFERLSLLHSDIMVLKKLLKVYDKASQQNNYLKMSELLDKITQILEGKLAKLDLDHNEWIESQRKRIESIKEEVSYKVGKRLNELLSEHGLSLEGNFPQFKVSVFFLEIDIDSATAGIWYGNKEEFVDRVPIVPERISKVVIDTYLKISRHKDDAKFLDELYQAYKNAIKKIGRNVGDEVYLTEVLKEILLVKQDTKFFEDPRRSNYKEYTRMQFSYDLATLRKREIDGRKLTLSIATRAENRERAKYIWIPDVNGRSGTVYSKIAFRSES